jgi:hypothetical protein
MVLAHVMVSNPSTRSWDYVNVYEGRRQMELASHGGAQSARTEVGTPHVFLGGHVGCGAMWKTARRSGGGSPRW